MSIPSIQAGGRVSAAAAEPSALEASAAADAAAARAKLDPVTQQPMPPRFPWLSRLSQELGPAAKQRPAFSSAPILGDRLDQSA